VERWCDTVFAGFFSGFFVAFFTSFLTDLDAVPDA
jgi:hypothetical protein